ncbi:MAG: response regulator [Gammaproteobacteria bacterium]|nr:response regulator [Gammaproteobacteria bacterium]
MPSENAATSSAIFDVRVLLVEDDDPLRSSIELILRDLGCRVLTAGNGEEALDVLAASHREIDVVFSDVVMPGRVSGYQLAQRVRDFPSRIRVLLTSGYPLDARGYDQNTPLLDKPYTEEQLATALAALLQHESDDQVNDRGR